MATKRMFSKKITTTDTFLDMPLSAQSLYFHINMEADDDGFVANVKTIRRMVGASEDDLRLLIGKQFLIPFDNGIVVVRDWRIHNYIQKDRYTPTIYTDEKRQLTENEHKQYSLLDTECIQDGHNLDTQYRLDKSRLDKSRIDTMSEESDKVPYKAIIDHLNERTGKNYKETAGATRKLIKARWNEGHREDAFKKAIDNKCADWLGNEKFEQYLRPQTLFGTKFEGYLNEQPKKEKITRIRMGDDIYGELGF